MVRADISNEDFGDRTEMLFWTPIETRNCCGEGLPICRVYTLMSGSKTMGFAHDPNKKIATQHIVIILEI
jgi:hypothetical protein